RKRSSLPDGTLVEVTAGAKLAFRGQSSGGKAGNDGISVSVSSPMVFRTGGDLFRAMNIDWQNLEQEGDAVASAGAGGGAPGAGAMFSDAWRKLALLTGAPPPPTESKEGAGDGHETRFGMRRKSLSIVAPSNESIVLAKSFPTSLKVVWHDPQAQKSAAAQY